MALSLRLDVRQSQNLVLTPQMQQAIKLLQLSNLELAATLQREIADNPFLSASEPAARARAPAAERTAPLAGTPPEHERDRAATATDQRLGLRRTSAANTRSEQNACTCPHSMMRSTSAAIKSAAPTLRTKVCRSSTMS